MLLGLSSLIIVPLFEWLILELSLGRWVGYSFRHLVSLQLSILVPMFLPLTIAVSILRYRLWDADLIINRTLVYGMLTAMILALYGLSVELASTLAPAQNRWQPSAVALGVIVLLAAQLRPRLQTIADRWLPASRVEIVPDTSVPSPAPTGILRLAHLVWIVTFLTLSSLAANRLITEPGSILSIEGDYLVEQSLQLSWLPADLFIPYIQIFTRSVVAVTFWLVASLIFLRKRWDWFALGISYTFLVSPFGQILDHNEYPFLNVLSTYVLLTLALFPFLFPDGRFIPRSTRLRFAIFCAVVLISSLVYAILRMSQPEYLPGEAAYGSMMAGILVMLAGGLGSQVYRYRHISNPAQRLQVKWVLFGLGIQLLWITWLVLWITGLLSWLSLSEPLIAFIMLHLSIAGTMVMPVVIGVSILRYRLWDIDLLISRTLVYGGLTLLVAAGYIILVGVLGVLFQAGNSLFLSILSTGLIAILFHPLRQHLQKTVNRLMYGDRDDPATVLSHLSNRLANTDVPGEILPTIVETIAQALKLPFVAILQESTGRLSEELLAEYGRFTSETEGFSLIYQGQSIGQLVVAPRASGEVFTPGERRLLENIAQQAGAAVYAAQLTRHLQHSRQQLVTSREEERRRIRRDLHDGLGPQLATMSLKLDAIGNYLTSDRESAERLVQELTNQVQDAIQDIRRLVYGLRPPALDQLGLVPALCEYAAQNSANGLHIRIDAPQTLPSLPAAVEVAAYRIALEGMTNTARHARASQCTVKLNLENELYLEIIDNGVGLPAQLPSGVGLASIRERTAELGGVFSLKSSPGTGTHLFVRIPLT